MSISPHPTRFLIILFTLILSTRNTLAMVQSQKVLSTKTNTMPAPRDCRTMGICDLKGAKTIETKFMTTDRQRSLLRTDFLTQFQFVLETDSPEAFKNYGVVQQIKGCMFEIEELANGAIETRFTFVHRNFGRYRLVYYNDWVIDAQSEDPLTSAYEGYDRFDLYQWNKDPRDLSEEKAQWVFNRPPPHGTVFKSEIVGTAAVTSKKPLIAQNSSLLLRTCLFKIGDLPLNSTPTGAGIDFNKSLWCSDWSHNFVYDEQTKKMQQMNQISDSCKLPHGPQPFF